MPCRGPNWPENTDISEMQWQGARKEMDMLTNLLCSAMKIIYHNGCEIYASDELVSWWEDHKQLDAERTRKLFEEWAEKNKIESSGELEAIADYIHEQLTARL